MLLERKLAHATFFKHKRKIKYPERLFYFFLFKALDSKTHQSILLRLLVKHNALELPFSTSSPSLFRNIGKLKAKKYFADH